MTASEYAHSQRYEPVAHNAVTDAISPRLAHFLCRVQAIYQILWFWSVANPTNGMVGMAPFTP